MKKTYFSLILCAFFLLSCQSFPFAFQKPHLVLKEIALADATLSDTVMIFRLQIENPNSAPLPVSGIDYDIKLNGKLWASGETAKGLKIRSGSDAEVEIPIRVNFTTLFDSIMVALYDKEVDYELNATLRAGGFHTPLHAKGRTAILP